MPYADPAVRAAKRKAYNQQHAETRRQQHMDNRHAKAKPFCGTDGEGGDINGHHEYLLLRAGEFVLETGKPLTTEECLEFLVNLPSGREYVSYFFTYDVTMMLRDVSRETMEYLLDRALRDSQTDDDKPPRRVRWGKYILDWMPGKEFRVGKYVRVHTQKGAVPQLQWTVINDVGSFFQCAFVTALEKWSVGSEALRAHIAASKAKRSGFTTITKLTRLYNKKECDLLEELMTEFRDVCGEVGPHPYHWQGPGNLASAWMRHHDIPSEHNVPFEAMSMARDGYYGGRFEITAVGSIRRRIYQYDINSAYPATIRHLPCLVHGAWKRSTKQQPRRKIYVARVEFYHKEGTFLGTLPVRSREGNISYPRKGSGVYWSMEIAAAKRAGTQITIHEAWEYIPDCKCETFNWINDVFELRRTLGKSNKGNALKLAMNSLYGKTAQSIGRPKWANPVWAGIITASCRAQIIDACSQVDGRHILMIATDGIFSDVPLTLDEGTALGQWDLTEHESMFIIQPGLYLLPGEAPKTRGVPKVKIVEHARTIRKSWAEGHSVMKHTIPLNRFRAARQAIHENKWGRAGEWYTEERTVSFDWTTKRDAVEGTWGDRLFDDDRPEFRPEIQQGTAPYDGDGNFRLTSVSYGKSIGMWERNRGYDDDQPEEADQFS